MSFLFPSINIDTEEHIKVNHTFNLWGEALCCILIEERETVVDGHRRCVCDGLLTVSTSTFFAIKGYESDTFYFEKKSEGAFLDSTTVRKKYTDSK